MYDDDDDDEEDDEDEEEEEEEGEPIKNYLHTTTQKINYVW